MMRSAEIDSRAASSRTARVASRLLYGPPNTIRGLSTRRNGIGLDIKSSPALCLAMIAAASPYSATPGWGTNISAGIGPSDERPAPSGKSGSYVLGGALCTSAECRPEKAPERRMTERDVGDGTWAPFRLLAFDHSAFIVALQPTLVLDETGDGVDALAGAQIAEHEGTRAAHAPGVALHDRERGADVGREIDFVDHEQVGTRDARATFGRNLVASGDVDDVERQVRELRRKCRGQVVAPGFDQNEIERRKFLLHLRDRGEIDRSVLADRGVRAAAGLDASDPLGRKRPGPHEIFGIPLCVNVIGDRCDLVAVAQPLAQRVHQRGLARADRAADPDAQRTVGTGHASTPEQPRALRLVAHACFPPDRWSASLRRGYLLTSHGHHGRAAGRAHKHHAPR